MREHARHLVESSGVTGQIELLLLPCNMNTSGDSQGRSGVGRGYHAPLPLQSLPRGVSGLKETSHS